MYSPEPVGVQKLFAIALFASLLIPSAVGQTGAQGGRPDLLTIVNARQTDIPIERARVLLVTACRVVAEEFHKRPEDLNLRMKLILGESHERVFVDDSGGMTLYLEHWNETKFVDGIITGAMQLLMPLDTRKHVFT